MADRFVWFRRQQVEPGTARRQQVEPGTARRQQVGAGSACPVREFFLYEYAL